MQRNKLSVYFLMAAIIFLNNVNAQTDSIPKVFQPGIVSAGYNERDMAISPDGKEMFYTILAPRNAFSVIVHRKLVNGKWTDAEVATFSGKYPDLEPAFSPDGKKIFFVSTRPVKKDTPKNDYDIWYVEKNKESWSAPIHAGNIINSDVDEYYPSVANDGSVYFTSARKDAAGEEDIYKSQFTNGSFQPAVSIGGGVSTKLDEFNAFVDPAEKYIIFSAAKGEEEMGRGDLYISFRNVQGLWGKAKNLGAKINSTRLDYCPFVHKGILYFTSERSIPRYDQSNQLLLKEIKAKMDSWGNGLGDIYYVSIDNIIKPG